MRNCLLYIVLLLSTETFGQSLDNDTVKIDEVVIKSLKGTLTPGYKRTTIDSSVLKSYNLGTVADIMSESSSVFIKSYGAGGTATPSFRGTGATNTQVNWNGIRIDHPMLGQSDLSLLPSGMIDDLYVYFGGASMMLNSGASGGIISVETKPVWRKGTNITLNSGMGSFQNYSGFVSVRSGSLNFQSVTRAFIQSSENNFKYLDKVSSSIPFYDIRKNSQFTQNGFLQELYYKKSGYVFSARLWYQNAARNLPASILAQQSGANENQSDESIRALLNYINNTNDISYNISGAWMRNRLNYHNRLASIDSRNLSDIILMKAVAARKIGNKARMELVLNEEYNIIESNNYNANSGRNTASFALSIQSQVSGKLNGSVLLREILHGDKLLVPDFSSGLQLKLSDSKNYFLKANFSRTSRLPGMNDLFWSPGGNSNLKNEYSYISELNYEMQDNLSSAVVLNYNLSVFRNSINDMIKWQPSEEFSFWTVDNIKKVNSSGAETSFSLNYNLNGLTANLNTGYSYTRATEVGSEVTDKRQLIYTPVNQANASIRIKYGMIYATWRSNITGKRYTTADNSKFLPAFFVNNFSAGIKYDTKWGVMDVNCEILNLLNVDYETIAYYPLPGRTYMIKIMFQIFK